MIPNNWKTRLGYREQLLKFIGEDNNFCNYLVKNNGSKTLDTYGGNKNINNNNEEKSSKKEKDFRLKKSNQDDINYNNQGENSNSNNNSDFMKQRDLNESIYTSNRKKDMNTTNFELNNNNSNMEKSGYNNFNEFNNKNNNNENIIINETPGRKNHFKNLKQINESKKCEEDEGLMEKEKVKIIKRSSSSSKNYGTAKRFNSNNYISHISEKEKRTILEHYRNLYSFKKHAVNNNSKLSEFENNIINKSKNFPLFPNINNNNNNFQNFNNTQAAGFLSTRNNNNFSANFNSNNNNLTTNSENLGTEANNNLAARISPEKQINKIEKNSMFRSSIYSNLMPKNSNSKNKKNFKSENDQNESSQSKNKNKSKAQTSYGPFLNINNEFDQEIVITNPEIKRSLEDINYYGPYFSHCPLCKNRNLDFYQTMEPHQCLKLLNYIKKKRTKIHLK